MRWCSKCGNNCAIFEKHHPALAFRDGVLSGLSFHDIFPHRHRVAVELDADFHHSAAFGVVWERVVLAVDLVEGFLCRAVHLQLEDVGGVGHLQHYVNATLGALYLRAGVEVQHIENQPESVFVEALIIGNAFQFFLEALNVGDACEEGFQFGHGGVDVVSFQETPKAHGETARFELFDTCVGRYHILHKTGSRAAPRRS